MKSKCQLILITSKEVNKRSRNCIFPNRYIYINMKPLCGHGAVRDSNNIIYQTDLKLLYTTVTQDAFLYIQVC